MGNMTGLNPVWIIVSLFVGGKLGGILGLLLAVPLASVIKSTVDNHRNSLRDRSQDKPFPVLIQDNHPESTNPLFSKE
jgi:predicted PurR-regulated permease PerM